MHTEPSRPTLVRGLGGNAQRKGASGVAHQFDLDGTGVRIAPIGVVQGDHGVSRKRQLLTRASDAIDVAAAIARTPTLRPASTSVR